ncbi:hypothetical protein U91I_01235 [alpha proteobacterium U9-1i]|nr:hypothetical protein U91I_01235 [alpha proteobacterium U9-1i]
MDADGYFNTCVIWSEEPTGWDFGRHAIDIACSIYRDPNAPPPTLTEPTATTRLYRGPSGEERMRVPLPFRLRDR